MSGGSLRAFHLVVFEALVGNDPVGYQTEALRCGGRRIPFGQDYWVIDKVDALEDLRDGSPT